MSTHLDLARQVLTAKQYRVLELRLAGHSWTTIALALGTSPSNARQHWNASLRKLRPHIQAAAGGHTTRIIPTDQTPRRRKGRLK